MKLTADRTSHLSHLILDHLNDDGFIFMAEKDEPAVLRQIKKVFVDELEREEALDEKIRKKIASYQRRIPEGSNEWQILYQRFYQEEKGRTGGS